MDTTDTFNKAECVGNPLRRIAMLIISVPITLVIRNARCRKCNIKAELASHLNIELIDLTTYSLKSVIFYIHLPFHLKLNIAR